MSGIDLKKPILSISIIKKMICMICDKCNLEMKFYPIGKGWHGQYAGIFECPKCKKSIIITKREMYER